MCRRSPLIPAGLPRPLPKGEKGVHVYHFLTAASLWVTPSTTAAARSRVMSRLISIAMMVEPQCG